MHLRTTVTKGYCKISVGGRDYITDAIYTDSQSSLRLTLNVTNANTDVIFTSVWGLPAEVNVKADGTLKIE